MTDKIIDPKAPTHLPKPPHRRKSDGMAVWSTVVECWIARPDHSIEEHPSVRAGLWTVHPPGTRFNPVPHDGVDWAEVGRGEAVAPEWVTLPERDVFGRFIRDYTEAHFLKSGRFVWARASEVKHLNDVDRYAIERTPHGTLGRLTWGRGESKPKRTMCEVCGERGWREDALLCEKCAADRGLRDAVRRVRDAKPPHPVKPTPYGNPDTCPHFPQAKRKDGTCGMCGAVLDVTRRVVWTFRKRRNVELDDHEKRARTIRRDYAEAEADRTRDLLPEAMWPEGLPGDTAEVRRVPTGWMMSDLWGWGNVGARVGVRLDHENPYRPHERLEYRRAGCKSWWRWE